MLELGCGLGLRRFAGDVAEPILVSLYTIPKVTLYPVMLLIFGLGMSAKVAFGVIHGMIPVMLFTLARGQNAAAGLLRTARVLRLTPTQTGASRAAAGRDCRKSSPACGSDFAVTLLGVLIGEMFASQRGLGFLIINGINRPQRAHDDGGDADRDPVRGRRQRPDAVAGPARAPLRLNPGKFLRESGFERGSRKWQWPTLPSSIRTAASTSPRKPSTRPKPSRRRALRS